MFVLRTTAILAVEFLPFSHYPIVSISKSIYEKLNSAFSKIQFTNNQNALISPDHIVNLIVGVDRSEVSLPFYNQIQQSMQKALKEGDKDRVRTLRTLLSKLKEKIIEKGEELSEAEEIKVFQRAAKQRRESIEMYKKGGRDDLVAAESKELAIIESYLPEQMSTEELIGIIDSIIQETGATTMKDMGKVMPLVMKQVSGRVDGKLVQQLVRKKLEG